MGLRAGTGNVSGSVLGGVYDCATPPSCGAGVPYDELPMPLLRGLGGGTGECEVVLLMEGMSPGASAMVGCPSF